MPINFTNHRDFIEELRKTDIPFKQILVTSKIGEEFYVSDLTSTPIYKTLKDINQEIESLKKFVIRNTDINIYSKEAEISASSIIDLVTQLTKTLRSLLLAFLLKDNDNIFIDIESMHGGDHAELADRYQRLKRHFNYFYRKRRMAFSNIRIKRFNLNSSIRC